MRKNKRKIVTKREIVEMISILLGRKMSKEHIIIPVVNAFIDVINQTLERGFEIDLRGFGNFKVKEIKRDKCIVGGKEYTIKKKRKVIFKYHNSKFTKDCKVAQSPVTHKYSTSIPMRTKVPDRNK